MDSPAKTKPIWVIEAYCWEDGSVERLQASVLKQGMKCFSVSPESARNGLKEFGEGEDCVVFYGSLETARLVVSQKGWIPGAFYTPANYECSRYYPAFGDLLLNADRYGFYPYGDLLRQKDNLFELYGVENAIFIRPNDGNKSFTGRMIYRENFVKDVEYCGFYGLDPHTLVVVSTPKNVIEEWRYFVSGGEVITGSLYRRGTLTIRELASDPFSLSMAKKAAGMYNPDGVWSVDICRTQGGNLYVLEIGCMSCAGVYACDTDKLVEVASSVALKEWESYQK